MNVLLEWLKVRTRKTGEKRYIIIFRAVLMALLPFFCCFVYCAMRGESIVDVYLPSSEWNDELFYYKQVEGIVKYGYPLGYFGFNESHAIKLSFAAWSPVLVFPWVIWGIVFGWSLLSPVICNIVLLTTAMFLFVCLAKPTWRQSGVLALLFCLYTLFVRYMLSGMPEVICFSMLIVFYALAVNYLDNEKLYKLVLMFLISALLTLMRPYMLLFMLLPIYLSVRSCKAKGIAGSALTVAVTVTGYALIKRYLGAEYFAPLFFTDWITAFFDEGLAAGIHNLFGTLYWMGRGFAADMLQGFRTGLASGAFFGGFTVMLLALAGQSAADWFRIRRNGAQALKKQLIIELHLAFCFTGMLFALLLMYKLTEGSKHLLTFMAVGIFVVALMDTKAYKKAVLIGVVFAYLFSYKASEPYDYQVPFADESVSGQLESWREVFEENIFLVREESPSFDNVIIWLFSDIVEGETVNTRWQLLYALPEGMGISCCTKEYLEESFDSLSSRYIAMPSGGEIDIMCKNSGYTELHRDKDMVVYQRY
ncbi:MAG: hypothetical protein LUG83_07140 [Lachnospiraceae bacterium]|nr:hypothetical protein [Lachnospiraceae bacterium]